MLAANNLVTILEKALRAFSIICNEYETKVKNFKKGLALKDSGCIIRLH
jgi:hypothetical protein